jgi:hypothetical protein
MAKILCGNCRTHNLPDCHGNPMTDGNPSWQSILHLPLEGWVLPFLALYYILYLSREKGIAIEPIPLVIVRESVPY